MSETEPELGLGTITHSDGRYVDIAFYTRETNRRYSIAGAPLKRIVFKPGDSIHDKSGATLRVTSPPRALSGRRESSLSESAWP